MASPLRRTKRLMRKYVIRGVRWTWECDYPRAMNTPTAYPSDVAFTDSVKAQQSRMGSRRAYSHMEEGARVGNDHHARARGVHRGAQQHVPRDGERRGQPYIQHRGGPPGFLRVLDEHTFGFADFAGNKQYITLGQHPGEPEDACVPDGLCASATDQDLGRVVGGGRRCGAQCADEAARLQGARRARDVDQGGGVGRELSAAHPDEDRCGGREAAIESRDARIAELEADSARSFAMSKHP